MNCKHCDYPLWNLRSRQCPECGMGFRPSEFRFAQNSVRYACLHCGQDYYGTGLNGHLEPQIFGCVGCGETINMDEMVLLPTEGVTERQTHADINPWLDEGRRFRSRWFGTLYRGAATPSWLMRSTTIDSGAGKAWGFALLSFVLLGFVMLSPIFLFMIAGALMGGGGAIGFFGAFLGFGVMIATISAVGLGVWILTAHGVLRLGGTTQGGLGRTAQALCYTCGPQMCVFFPCLGIYFGWLGTIWWVVAAGFALASAQRVGGLRAAMAVAVLPVVCGVLVLTGVVFLFTGAATGWSGANWANAESVTVFRTPLHEAAAAGAWPAHAGEFLLDGSLAGYDFTSPMSATTPTECVIDTASLATWDGLSPTARQGMVDRAVAAMPEGVVAHLLGDFVFTYHGIDPVNPPDDLWLVIEAWDPTVPGQYQSDIHALTTQGTVVTFAKSLSAMELSRQNVLRASHGLAPLPEPFSVRPSKPAAATLPEDPG